jgi:hypothetical protein
LLREKRTEIVPSLVDRSGWRAWTSPTGERRIVVDLTCGEDPREFLGTATRLDPHPLICSPWDKSRSAEELAPRMRQMK